MWQMKYGGVEKVEEGQASHLLHMMEKKKKKKKVMQFEQNNTLFHVVVICYSIRITPS
jgi:hypothetical protein